MNLSKRTYHVRPGTNQLRDRSNSLTTRGDETRPKDDYKGAEDDKPRIVGIAAPYNSWTTLYESPRIIEKEQYARGCFRTDESDVMSTFNHNLDRILGRMSAGTMRLIDTDEGLKFEVDVNLEDPMAVGVYARVKRGEVNSASTWFYIERDGVDTKETKLDSGKWMIEYTIKEAVLHEAGPVTDGQYEKATSEARNLIEVPETRESYKDFMKRLGLEA